MIVSEMRGAGAVLSGVVDIVSYIHELHKLYDVNVDSLITHGACIAPNTSILPDPLSFPQTLQFLDQLVHVDMLIALTVFTEFPESFFNTKVLPHFGGSMAKNLYKSLSDINGQKQSLKVRRAGGERSEFWRSGRERGRAEANCEAGGILRGTRYITRSCLARSSCLARPPPVPFSPLAPHFLTRNPLRTPNFGSSSRWTTA